MRRPRPLEKIALLAALIFLIAAAPSSRSADSKFLRFVPDATGGGKLQTSTVTYRNADGVTLDLVGAVHIADPSYFDGLNEQFKQYDAVLYEMVKPRGAAAPSRAGEREPATAPTRARAGHSSRMSWVGALQRFMKDKLDLRFQLEEIDYERPNFVHADLDAETFFEMQDARGESFFKLMLQSMLRELGRGGGGAVQQQATLGGLLMAMQAPDRARQMKLVIAREFGQMEDLLAGMEGPRGSVIISERNKAALKVLNDRIAAGDKRIAIFYGAGHLNLMEKTLTEEMGFKQVGEPKWRDAWDMTAPATQPATTAPAR
jgi:hypothetical protein